MNKYKQIEQQILNTLSSIRNGRGSLYDIATWCLELFNESDTYADAIGVQPDDIVDHINNRFLKDFAVELEEIVILLKYFPDREQWNRPVLDLLDHAHEQIARERKETVQSQPKRTRKTVKIAEFEKVKEEAAAAKTAADRERESAAKAISELDQAKARIRELEIENAMLRGKIDAMRNANENLASV